MIGIIKAFEISKEKYGVEHKLVLAGKPGHGYEDVSTCVSTSVSTKDIIETGYISEEDKWELLKNADVFLFPTFYEGFGIPVLEAQSVGVPVVAGNNSSIPEIVSPPIHFKRIPPPSPAAAGRGARGEGSEEVPKKQTSALLVNVNNPEEIAQATWKLISNESFKKSIIQAGYENVKRFSWDKCAKEISEVLVS